MQLTGIFTATMAATVTMAPMAAASGNTGKLGKLFTELFAPGTGAGSGSGSKRAVSFIDGGSEGHFRRAEDGLPPGVPQQVIDGCGNQTRSGQVEVKKEGSGSECKCKYYLENLLICFITTDLRATKVPSDCMTFATYWTDDASPHPCGNDCLLYEGLNEKQMNNVVDAANQNLPGVDIK